MLVVMLLFQFQVLLNAQNNDKSKDEYKFVIFSEFCFDQFFGDEDVSNECISDTISRTISILMVGFAVMNQVPQIYKILKSQSIQGISFNAYYTELYLFSFITAYNLYKQTKFILYGENAIVGLEYCIVLCLFLFYDKILNFHQWLFKAVFFILINIPLYLGFGPQWIFDLTIYINMSLRKLLIQQVDSFRSQIFINKAELQKQKYRIIIIAHIIAKLCRQYSKIIYFVQ
ncbi:unnamed protein product [Paramecium sonneborni]|uniref:Transmembrane protein n=1 Tax=Paramecium sonneborni TaxID=65129 RepID=A0A8S1KFW5_9CILI|nr:unnamed protein product [Paramecium sonneborni]